MDRSRRDMFIAIGVVSSLAVGATVFMLLVHGLRPDIGGVPGLLFWIGVTLLAGFVPIKLSQGTVIAPISAPILAALMLGGPAAAAVVAFAGAFDRRELKGEVAWYGTLYNHSVLALSIIIAGVVFDGATSLIALFLGPLETSLINPAVVDLALSLFCLLLAGGVDYSVNSYLTSMIVAIRGNKPIRQVWSRDQSAIAIPELSLTPLGWLMAVLFTQPTGWLLTVVFLTPLLATRVAYNRYAETRQHFLETISTLANAVDARDTYTHGHSNRVSRIAAALARRMGLPEKTIESIEWAGTLHDIGKIGIRDNILLKQSHLTEGERKLMNEHPIIGANILSPSAQLRDEAPIVRAHHEWFNGSGYPDGLAGEDIPLGARLMAVADAYEAMTAARPYRKVPLTHEEAVAQLVAYAGTQFDPDVVEVFLELPRSVVDPEEGAEKDVLTMWSRIPDNAPVMEGMSVTELMKLARPQFDASPHEQLDDFHQHLGAPRRPEPKLIGSSESHGHSHAPHA